MWNLSEDGCNDIRSNNLTVCKRIGFSGHKKWCLQSTDIAFNSYRNKVHSGNGAKIMGVAANSGQALIISKTTS